MLELSEFEHLHTLQRMVGHLRNVNEVLVRRVAKGLGFEKSPGATIMAIDGQLTGNPSVLLDAIAIILSDEDDQTLLKKADIKTDKGALIFGDGDKFIAVAMTSLWNREKSVRTLA